MSENIDRLADQYKSFGDTDIEYVLRGVAETSRRRNRPETFSVHSSTFYDFLTDVAAGRVFPTISSSLRRGFQETSLQQLFLFPLKNDFVVHEEVQPTRRQEASDIQERLQGIRIESLPFPNVDLEKKQNYEFFQQQVLEFFQRFTPRNFLPGSIVNFADLYYEHIGKKMPNDVPLAYVMLPTSSPSPIADHRDPDTYQIFTRTVLSWVDWFPDKDSLLQASDKIHETARGQYKKFIATLIKAGFQTVGEVREWIRKEKEEKIFIQVNHVGPIMRYFFATAFGSQGIMGLGTPTGSGALSDS